MHRTILLSFFRHEERYGSKDLPWKKWKAYTGVKQKEKKEKKDKKKTSYKLVVKKINFTLEEWK